MFGTQFFPTPQITIREMVKDLDLHHKWILDPSAGRGDILDYVKERTRYSYGYNEKWDSSLFAIELDPDLRQVLLGKGYKVVDSDFLHYSGQMYFDYILMNPPFKDGVKHLLKAWEISNGATVRCLLNTESLRNPYTQERQQLAAIIQKYGSVKDLGRPFLKADNPTDVEVSLVSLKDTRPKESFRLNFDPAKVGKSDYKVSDIEDTELAPADIFESYEARHRAAVEAFKRLLEARQEVVYYMAGLVEGGNDLPEIVSRSAKIQDPDLAYNDFLDVLTKSGWNTLFRKTKLSNVTTESVRQEVEKMQAAQGTMAFTASNMRDLFDLLFLNREQIMVNCVLEAFDKLTKHHPDNRENIEGWKSNAAYLVGKKFILPNIGSVWGNGLEYANARDLDDLEKAMCFLTGKKFESILHIRDVYDHKDNFGQWMVSEFFITQLYQRHTMHFKWRDEMLRNEFNAMVAKHRWGWIPEKVKTGAYK